MKRPRPSSRIGKVIAFLFAFAFVGVIGSCFITIGIWPGQVKLLAPIFCTDAQPDAFVVADTYSPQPGETVTNFSLYCMGPRGDSTDHGFMKPFLLISVVNGIILMGLLISLGGLGSSAMRKNGGPDLREQVRAAKAERDAERNEATPSDPDPFDIDGLSDITQDPPITAPRPPNTAPPGSTPGPFVN